MWEGSDREAQLRYAGVVPHQGWKSQVSNESNARDLRIQKSLL